MLDNKLSLVSLVGFKLDYVPHVSGLAMEIPYPASRIERLKLKIVLFLAARYVMEDVEGRHGKFG